VVIPRFPRRREFSRREVSWVILITLLVAQILFSLLNTNSFKNCYLEITREKTWVLGSLLKEDVDFMLSKGIALNRLFMMEKMLGEILKASPELSDITLLDSEFYPLYKADKKSVLAVKKGEQDPLRSVHTTHCPPFRHI